MASRWLLDTSALLALRDNEAGAEHVAALLRQAIDGQSMVLACFMSRMEVLYRVWKDENERQARLADAQLQSLPIRWVAASDPLLERAAAIKAPPWAYAHGGSSTGSCSMTMNTHSQSAWTDKVLTSKRYRGKALKSPAH